MIKYYWKKLFKDSVETETQKLSGTEQLKTGVARCDQPFIKSLCAGKFGHVWKCSSLETTKLFFSGGLISWGQIQNKEGLKM